MCRSYEACSPYSCLFQQGVATLSFKKQRGGYVLIVDSVGMKHKSRWNGTKVIIK